MAVGQNVALHRPAQRHLGQGHAGVEQGRLGRGRAQVAGTLQGENMSDARRLAGRQRLRQGNPLALARRQAGNCQGGIIGAQRSWGWHLRHGPW